MTASAGRLARGIRSGAALAGLMVLTALIVSVGAGRILSQGQRALADQELQRRATLVAEAVANETGRYTDTVRTVAASTGSFETLTTRKFAGTTRALADLRLAGATSIAYLVPATDEQIPAVQELWRTRGVPDLRLQPSGTAREHIFSVFSVPLDGVTQPRYGIDATQSAPATWALTEARRSGHVTITDPYQLIIDQQLPPQQRQQSFVLTAPVYGPPEADGRQPFKGWVLMGIRGRDFITATLARAAQNQIDVTLRAPANDGTYTEVATQKARTTGRRDLSRPITIPVADRSWRLEVAAISGRLPGNGALPLVVTGSGTMLGLLLAGLVFVLATGRSRAEAQVRTSTADLATAEAAARDQADLLASILNAISDGVGVVDNNGEFLLHNPAAKAILGITEDKGGADNWQAHYGIFTPDGGPFPTEQLPLVRALAGHSSEQVEMLIRNQTNPDGITITVSGRPLHTTAGLTGAVAVFHDITARKRAKAELAATAEQLRTARDDLARQKDYLTQVLNLVDVTVITCDTTGRIIHANHAAHPAFTVDPPTSVTDAVAAIGLCHPEGKPVQPTEIPLLRALRGEPVHEMEAVIPDADGSRRTIMIHANPLTDPTGTITGAVAASYNITALREHEAELRAFAAVVAHDLKAPLTAIGGYAEILDDDLTEHARPESLRASVRRICASVTRMRSLIDDLLAYATARDTQLNPKLVDLQAVVADVVAERTAHLRGGTDTHGQPALFPDIYTGPLPHIHADPVMVRQLLDNLIGNALKYTLPGQPARLDISANRRAGDNMIRMQVADRGIGIPIEEQPHVFDTFHRAAAHTAYTGHGLGLAICHRIITRHGGTITATDNPGGGTRISFTLPTTPNTPPESADEPAIMRRRLNHHGK